MPMPMPRPMPAHLVDRVLPRVPVRQWVLSLPFRIRFLLAYDPKLCAAARSLFLRTILRFLRRRGEEQGFCDGRSGAVNVVQRFGSTLNLNVHFHALILDGVFTRTSPDEPPVFHALPPPSDDDIADLTETLRRRILRLLHRRGRLRDDEILEGSEQDSEPLLAACYAASIQGRVALGKDAGSAVQRTGKIPGLSPVHPATRRRCAQIGGFSLHADVRIAARDRPRLERICRYVFRGPIAQDRLFQTKDGRVEYVLRTPFKDGTRSVLFEPLQFIEKLAALVPRPRAHLVTYHGVLAPAAEWRQDIVPTPNSPRTDCARPKKIQASNPIPHKRRYEWAELMHRVFEIQVLLCPHCQGERKVIATISQPSVIRDILVCLGLESSPPRILPPRAPPLQDLLLFQD